MIYQLMYSSHAKDKTNWETLEKVMETSINNNKEADLTGMLLFSGGQFLQVLEGDFEKINKIYYNICRDNRHDKIKLISFSPIKKRYFSNWNMRLVSYETLDSHLREHLTRKYGVLNNFVLIPDDPLLGFSLLFDIYTMDQSKPV